jgi:hypothetical protein
MDARYHDYVNYFSPSSSLSFSTVKLMGVMGNLLVRIFDKQTGSLRELYWQQTI